MSGVRVLVVDDAPDVRRLIGAIVRRHNSGWSVVAEADTGASAIARAELAQPDLVLLDAAMPVMDGIEALPQIRRVAPGSRVVLLTGFPSDALEERAREAGAHAYLEKDDLVATLIPRLESVLGGNP